MLYFVKEDIIPGTNTLEGYRVLAYNHKNKQMGSWFTDQRFCSLQDLDTDPYQLEVNLTLKQDFFNKVEFEFLVGDYFMNAAANKAVINTTRRITDLVQRVITAPSAGFVKDVQRFKEEYLVPDIEGEERKAARVALGDALENWFEEKIPDKDNIWFTFLRDTIEFVDWVLVAHYIDVGHWLYQPRLDNPLYDYTNSLTWSVVYYIESNDHPRLDSITNRYPQVEELADKIQGWFIKQLPHSVLTRDIFAQLVLNGIHCVDWVDVARSRLTD
jgi:hypothetical protein